ncbi:MAG: winged helix-turn-helix domain-containing protein [Eubacteriales bacterium]|nr:winged helix-turn-helix domain-containing protein [Eubacterium sp.]MDY5494321.1 winged helix-turn-helix domain-containing protein [Eubacteriales bacterium]
MDETSAKKKVLVIEDEKRISKVLEVNLLMAGYLCDTAFDGEEGLEKALTGNFDLILLDIMLPKRDGFSVCREIRKKLSTPIIMVTAKEEEIDKVMGLDLGADDYVTKPFSVKVLLARIKANIRRSSGEFVELRQPAPTEGLIVIRGLKIDTKNFRVTKDGREIELSRKEFEVLVFLASHPNELFSREELLEKVWGYEDFFGGIRTVDVTMSRLRSKIEDKPAEPEYILTKRTKGYYIPA